jgi:hypothetical protein
MKICFESRDASWNNPRRKSGSKNQLTQLEIEMFVRIVGHGPESEVLRSGFFSRSHKDLARLENKLHLDEIQADLL